MTPSYVPLEAIQLLSETLSSKTLPYRDIRPCPDFFNTQYVKLKKNYWKSVSLIENKISDNDKKIKTFVIKCYNRIKCPYFLFPSFLFSLYLFLLLSLHYVKSLISEHVSIIKMSETTVILCQICLYIYLIETQLSFHFYYVII